MEPIRAWLGIFRTTTQSADVVSLFRFCLKLNRLIVQIMFIDFILLSHPYDKSLGDAQSFNFTFFQFYKRKTARRLELYAFGRLRPYLGEQKSKLLLNSVVMSNFSYCPLIWLFCSKVANNEINRTHKRALRTLCLVSI